MSSYHQRMSAHGRFCCKSLCRFRACGYESASGQRPQRREAAHADRNYRDTARARLRRCGTHSLGLVYEFLLKTHGNPKQARADFVMFLSGELSARLLKQAQLWVSEEQGCEPPASIEDPIMATEHAGDPFCVPQASSNSRYEPIQASW